MTPDETSVVYETAGSVARITINRPDRRNAINPEVVRELAESLARAEEDGSISVAVLTGAGDKAFCAGGDLGGMTYGGRVQQHLERADVGRLFETMRASRLPIVARVNGHALAGGFGLMLACDLVVAAEGADVGTPEVDIGLWPFMITALIQRDVPRKIALEMMLTGQRMPVAEAHRWGFVNRVVAASDLDKEVDALAHQLAAKSPLILRLGKKSFYESEDMAVRQALDYLSGMLTVCLESEDAIEGVTAFLQKRPPVWKSR
ncbi:MAG: enoyl-CoA hydratase/isomerase family protein [Actinomycetota bacterium]